VSYLSAIAGAVVNGYQAVDNGCQAISNGCQAVSNSALVQAASNSALAQRIGESSLAGAVRESSFGQFYRCIKEQFAPDPVTAKEAATNALICVLSASTVALINAEDESFLSPSVLYTTFILSAVAAKTGQKVMRYIKEQRA